MWIVSGTGLTMTEGDYGIALPVNLSGFNFIEGDTIRYTFKEVPNAGVILQKDFAAGGAIGLTFTADESAKFRVGNYVYSVDWFREGSYLCNILAQATFKVVDKI